MVRPRTGTNTTTETKNIDISKSNPNKETKSMLDNTWFKHYKAFVRFPGRYKIKKYLVNKLK